MRLDPITVSTLSLVAVMVFAKQSDPLYFFPAVALQFRVDRDSDADRRSMPDDHSPLAPRLPIPNRTVKRRRADDSTDPPCESRSLSGTFNGNGPLAWAVSFCLGLIVKGVKSLGSPCFREVSGNFAVPARLFGEALDNVANARFLLLFLFC